MKKLLIIFAAAAALVACNKAETTNSNEPRAVRFTVQNLGTYELKSPTVALGQTGNSTVGIYAADLGANNVEATVSGGTLTPSSTIYWRIGQTTASDFIARYPYESVATIDGSYDLPADQTAEDTYTYHANVVTAFTSATPDPGTVAFDFKHPFAKVVISITNNLSADAVASVVMKNIKMSASKMDLKTAPATLTLTDAVSNVQAYAASENRYEMIIMPQAAAANMDIVVTTTLGSIYTFNITNASYDFLAGKVATAAVRLDPIGGDNGGGRTAIGAVSIHDVEEWTNGDATTTDGNGTPTLGAYYQIGGCVYTTDNTIAYWSKYFNMTYSAANTWTITINYDETMAGTDESGKGFLIRQGDAYYGMWTGSDYIPAADYTLEPTDETHSNIRLQDNGNYTITYNSSTRKISWVKN